MTKLLHLFTNFAHKWEGIRRQATARVHTRSHARIQTIVEISKFIIFTLFFLIDRERDALLRFSRS